MAKQTNKKTGMAGFFMIGWLPRPVFGRDLR